jgi:hypothetical protein
MKLAYPLPSIELTVESDAAPFDTVISNVSPPG